MSTPRRNPFDTENAQPSSVGALGLSKIEELTAEIDDIKKEILSLDENSEKRKRLVNTLVNLRFRVQEIKEGPVVVDESVRTVCNHHFVEQDRRGRNPYCEHCVGVIWRLAQPWYRCAECGYRCHAKCLSLVARQCAARIAQDTLHYELSICPEIGLGRQNYRCAECRTKISFEACEGAEEPRQCDYTGKFYCKQCHWNDAIVIPARVVHNWDFTPRPVCRATKQLLELLSKKPLIKLESFNPQLFNFVQDLRVLKQLRSNILIMKCYFLACKEARKQRMLWNLKRHLHFVDNHDVYSLNDLIELADGRLEAEVRAIIQLFTRHIKDECETCQGNGFICELCSDKSVIFPFDDNTKACHLCYAVFHKQCFQSSGDCPRCVRRLKRDAARAHQLDNDENVLVTEQLTRPFDSPENEENSGNNPFNSAEEKEKNEKNPFDLPEGTNPFDSPEKKENNGKNPLGSPEGTNPFDASDTNAYDPQLNPFE